METSYRPLTRKQRAELEGYVAWSTSLFRTGLFLVMLATASWIMRRFLGYPWWVAATAALGVVFFMIGRKGTGGRALRRKIRADLANGVAAVHRVVAVDAIEVEQAEDEGPGYFILTSDGRTMLFAGQYLERDKGRGFPWKEFEIVEAAESEVFFGLKPCGERLVPSLVRKPFTWEEQKKFSNAVRYYGFIDAPFADLSRRSALPR